VLLQNKKFYVQKNLSDQASLKIFVDKLKQIRISNKLTQEDFAELLGMSYKYYQRVETGKQNDLRFSTLDRFAQALGLRSWQLISPRPIKMNLKSRGKSSPHYKRKTASGRVLKKTKN